MIKESAFTFITKIILAFFGLIIAIITARVLGAEGRGVYYFLFSLIGVSILIGSLGINIANVYFIGRKEYSLNTLLGNSIFSGFCLGILVIIGILLLLSISPNLFKGIDPLFVLMVCALIPFQLISQLLLGLLLGLQRIFSYNIVQIIVNSIVVLSFLIFLPLFPEIKTAVYILLLAGFLWLIVTSSFLLVRQKEISLKKLKINFLTLKKSINFGLKGQLGNIAQFLNYRLDIFLINFFINPIAVGIYSIAVILGESLWYLTNSLATVLFPKISATKDNIESERITAKSCRLGFGMTIIGALILFFLAPWIIKILFGKEFLSGAMAFKILLPGIIIFSIANVLASYIAGKGFPQYNSLAASVSLIFTVGLDIFLIPKWGINGAALATTVSYIMATLIILYFYKKISSRTFNLKNLLIPQKEDFKSFVRLLQFK